MENLTVETFKEKVFDYTQGGEWSFKGTKPAIIDFYADSTKPQVPVSFVLFTDGKKNVPEYLTVMIQKGNQNIYAHGKTFVECSKDTLAYIVKKKLVYSIPPSNWITDFSFPRIETAWILYFPKREYDMIPDSLIRKSPF